MAPRRTDRLARQAQRTLSMRRRLYERIGLAHTKRVLDVGCGDGIVSRDVARHVGGSLVVCDHDARMLERARVSLADEPNVALEHADAHDLPFPDGRFDVAMCSLTLLWATDPARVVSEMARVTRPGGLVVAAMEPDYGGKLHHPENPVVDHVFADAAIRRSGGDPRIGRRLRELFAAAGLATQVGLLNPEIPSCDEDLATYREEGALYRRMLRRGGVPQGDIDIWQNEYVESLRAGTQFNWLPLFFAIGRKPGGPPRPVKA